MAMRGVLSGTVLVAAIVAAAAFGPPKIEKPWPKTGFGKIPLPKMPKLNVNIPKPSVPKMSVPKASASAPQNTKWVSMAQNIHIPKPQVPPVKPPLNRGATQKPLHPPRASGFPPKGPFQKPPPPRSAPQKPPPKGHAQKPEQVKGPFGRPFSAPPKKQQPPPRNLGQQRQPQNAARKGQPAGFKPPQIPKHVASHIAALQKQAKERGFSMSRQLPKHSRSMIEAAKRRLDPRASAKRIPKPSKMPKLPQLPKMPKFPKAPAMPKLPGFFKKKKPFGGKARTHSEN